MIPALIAAAATLGGAYLARRHEKSALQRRMEDAKKAGIHPTVAIGMPGGSSGSSSLFGEGMARSGQAIGNAVSRSLDTDSKALKALVLEKAGLENELLRAQVTRAKIEDAAVPSVLGPQSEYGIKGQAQTVRLPYVPGTTIAHKVEQPTWTPNLHVGVPFRTNPNFSDAQAIQNRYGELAENLYGAVTIPADLYQHNFSPHSGTGASFERIMRRLRGERVRSYQESQR